MLYKDTCVWKLPINQNFCYKYVHRDDKRTPEPTKSTAVDKHRLGFNAETVKINAHSQSPGVQSIQAVGRFAGSILEGLKEESKMNARKYGGIIMETLMR